MSDVRVRIAPSPTGNLHVGTARTALFNYLFAKHTGGKFVLRIEDTDLTRSEDQYVTDIYNGLKLLGLTWDEGPDTGGAYGPYKQSERMDLYKEYADKLLTSGAAYYCYCTTEELDAEKQVAMNEKRPYVYSRRCCNPETAATLEKEGRPKAIRFRIPEKPEKVEFKDLVRSDLSFESALIGDFVIVKSNGTASYNFAVVVDDITMKISHVIRGEDHISNTPKQILLYHALGAETPLFAHVGMILAPDRSKLSKRHGATAVAEFVRQGYLPEAFCNFLALLGWSPSDGQEVGTLDHFATQFTLDRIVQSPAVFDQEKLKWLNGTYIRSLELKDLLERIKPYLADYDLSRYPEDKLLLMLDAVREPLVVLSDVTDAVSYFFEDQPKTLDEAQAVLKTEDTQAVLKQFSTMLDSIPFDSPESVSAEIKKLVEAMKPMKTKNVMWALRASITGRVHGADLGKTLYILGKDVITQRVNNVLNKISV